MDNELINDFIELPIITDKISAKRFDSPQKSKPVHLIFSQNLKIDLKFKNKERRALRSEISLLINGFDDEKNQLVKIEIKVHGTFFFSKPQEKKLTRSSEAINRFGLPIYQRTAVRANDILSQMGINGVLVPLAKIPTKG